MNAERARTFLLSLPHVVETQQWGGLVFWVGDKALGGKMFSLMNPESDASGHHALLSYPAGPERFHELCELDGVKPAPYLARIFWIAAERWDVFREREWEAELRAGHAIVLDKLPSRTRALLALPKAEQKRRIAESRKILDAKAATKKLQKESDPVMSAKPRAPRQKARES